MKEKETLFSKKRQIKAVSMENEDYPRAQNKSMEFDRHIDFGELPLKKIQMPVFSDIAGRRAEDGAAFAKDKRLSFRHELKYYINYRDYAVLRQALKILMKPDPYGGKDGSYHIRSLYFDDREETALKEKLEGVESRAKYRIRIYNGGKDGVIRFEKKIKEGQFIAKQSFMLSLEEYEALIGGNYGFLLRRREPLAKELYVQMRTNGLAPRVIVDYTREAYIMDIERTRITFDKDLRGGVITSDVFEDILTTPVLDEGKMILEVKFNRFLPDYIKRVLSEASAPQRSAISKYVLCRKYD